MGLSKSAFDTALRSLYICLFALPGYLLSIFAVNPLGRWNIQLGGFIVVTILYFSMAIWYTELTHQSTALIIVYGMCYFFKNFGPNATTYIIPGEYYPSEVKGTLHGASAAAGKVGAGIAANAFPYIVSAWGVANMMYFCGSLALAGAIVTLIFVPRYHWTKLREQQAERMALVCLLCVRACFFASIYRPVPLLFFSASFACARACFSLLPALFALAGSRNRSFSFAF